MAAFVVDSALEVPVFLFVTLLETLEVVELVHEIGHLVFERSYLTVTLGQLLLLALKIKRFLVDQSVQLLDLVEGLGDVELEVSDVVAEVVAFVRFYFVGNVQPFDFLEVFAVALTQGRQLIVHLALLRLQAHVGVL